MWRSLAEYSYLSIEEQNHGAIIEVYINPSRGLYPTPNLSKKRTHLETLADKPIGCLRRMYDLGLTVHVIIILQRYVRRYNDFKLGTKLIISLTLF